MPFCTKAQAGVRLYLAFLAEIEAGQPIPQKKDQQTADRGNAQVDRSQGEPDPTPPKAEQVAKEKSKHTEEAKQDQPPKTTIANEMIESSIQQGDQQAEEKSR